MPSLRRIPKVLVVALGASTLLAAVRRSRMPQNPDWE